VDEDIIGIAGHRYAGSGVCALLLCEAHASDQGPTQVMKRVRQHLFMVGMLLLAGAMLACGGPWRDAYFKKGVYRLTQDEVAEKFGPPHTTKTPALGGDSIWTYRVPISDKELASVSFSHLGDTVKEASALLGKASEQGPKAMLYCYRYTLTFNEKKILKQWQRDECVPGTHDSLNAE